MNHVHWSKSFECIQLECPICWCPAKQMNYDSISKWITIIAKVMRVRDWIVEWNNYQLNILRISAGCSQCTCLSFERNFFFLLDPFFSLTLVAAHTNYTYVSLLLSSFLHIIMKVNGIWRARSVSLSDLWEWRLVFEKHYSYSVPVRVIAHSLSFIVCVICIVHEVF